VFFPGRGDTFCDTFFAARGTLLRLRFAPAVLDLSASLASDALGDTPLAAIAAEAGFSGLADIAAPLSIDFGFGVDESGFFITPDSSFALDVDIDALIASGLDLFSIDVGGGLKFTPRFTLAGINSATPARIRVDELQSGLAGLALELGTIDADLTFDAELGFLDYFDIDPLKPNTAHGGDPFVIRGQTSFTAPSQEFDSQTFVGLNLQWDPVRTLNPDIDGDGQIADVLAQCFKRHPERRPRAPSSKV
jgi:hypothetical protein